ncbi:MAG: hypothetical protein ABIT96_06575 [Ferruginibacter sp.]
MKKYLLYALVAGGSFTACQNNDEKGFDKDLQNSVKSDSPAVSALPVTVPDSAIMSSTAMPAAQPEAVTTTTISQSSATAKAGMNPVHGAPGHRCDIAVGAPLNSPKTSATSTVTQATPQPVSTTPTPDPIVTAPGMNPPHGQAGHDCSIAVGAPLKKN